MEWDRGMNKIFQIQIDQVIGKMLYISRHYLNRVQGQYEIYFSLSCAVVIVSVITEARYLNAFDKCGPG